MGAGLRPARHSNVANRESTPTERTEVFVSDSLAGQRFSMILLSVFAVIALLLSSIGVHGVL